ncbi:MAG: SDR family NAD(P)-dependent oxidoreductase, partial [Gammaproteobacteria bacterium]|nr:SDR family NAD(P)-dependent oxidoreductase [Gammaproteobacteria bacterium]
QAPVDDYEASTAMVDAVAADFGRLDILINNAGIASRGHTVESTDPAELERCVRVHAFAPHVLSKAAIP